MPGERGSTTSIPHADLNLLTLIVAILRFDDNRPAESTTANRQPRWCATRRARSPSLSCGMPSCRWVTHPGQLAPGVVSGTSHFGARLRLLECEGQAVPCPSSVDDAVRCWRVWPGRMSRRDPRRPGSTIVRPSTWARLVRNDGRSRRPQVRAHRPGSERRRVPRARRSLRRAGSVPPPSTNAAIFSSSRPKSAAWCLPAVGRPPHQPTETQEATMQGA